MRDLKSLKHRFKQPYVAFTTEFIKKKIEEKSSFDKMAMSREALIDCFVNLSLDSKYRSFPAKTFKMPL